MVSQAEGEAKTSGKLPTCPLCGGQDFRREEGRLDSKWGITSHRVILLICENCKYILHFYEGNSIWDFD